MMHEHSRRWGSSSVAAIAMVVSAVACHASPPETEAAPRRTDGPPSANSAAGGFAADPPPGHPGRWTTTFGFRVCSQTSAVPTIEQVTFPPSAPPGTKAVLRTVTAEQVRSSRLREIAPSASAWGSPPGWHEPYAQPLRGDYVDVTRGTPISSRAPSPRKPSRRSTPAACRTTGSKS